MEDFAVKRKGSILLSVVVFLMALCSCSQQKETTDIKKETTVGQETISAEDARRLKKEHPECFGLDKTDGLTVLGIPKNPTGNFSFYILSGNKKSFTQQETVEKSKQLPLDLADTKKMLTFYGLPESQIHLRVYIPVWSSAQNEITEVIRKNLGEEFDNRYKLEEDFKDQ